MPQVASSANWRLLTTGGRRFLMTHPTNNRATTQIDRRPIQANTVWCRREGSKRPRRCLLGCPLSCLPSIWQQVYVNIHYLEQGGLPCVPSICPVPPSL